MRRVLAAVPVVLLALSCATAQAATRAEPAPPLLLKPAIPAQLAELEAKADALRITSARVSISTSVRLGRPSKLARELARLLDFEVSGVETSSPPASALTIKLLGAHVRLRFAAGHVYLFVWALARHDGGRPWVRLGRGALGRLFGGLARKRAEKEVSGAVRYAELFTLLNGGAGIRALAPTTLYGQLGHGLRSGSRSRRRRRRRPRSVLRGAARDPGARRRNARGRGCRSTSPPTARSCASSSSSAERGRASRSPPTHPRSTSRTRSRRLRLRT